MTDTTTTRGARKRQRKERDYLVSIERVTHYKVRAASEDDAIDAALDGEGIEEGGDTTDARAELYDNDKWPTSEVENR